MATLEEQKKLLVPFLQVCCLPPLGARYCAAAASPGSVAVASLHAAVGAAVAPSKTSCPSTTSLLISPPSSVSATSPAVPQRAQEIERAEPKVAYYCRMYALEQVRGVHPAWLLRRFLQKQHAAQVSC